MMRVIWLSAAVLIVGTVSAHAQTGDVSAGKAFWSGNATLCRQCHGANGEGGFGPDLAGRALTIDQFERAVRQPWGVMPAFTEEQVSRQQIMNLVAFFDSLPRVAAPAAWRVPLESTMPLGQQLATANGCTQCHGAELPQLRAALGAVAPDYAWFSRLVYSHTAEMPALEKMLGDNAPIRMGNFSQLRLTEPTLQEIWKYISADLGWRARVQARMMPGTPATGGMAYSVNVTNAGVPGKAPTVEDVTVSVTLAPGTTVVGTTGNGYQGTRKDEKGLDVATWRIPRMAPSDMQTLTITVSGNAPTAGAVRWVKPAQKNGAAFDTVNVALPPRAAATQ